MSLPMNNPHEVSEKLSREKIVVSARPGILWISTDFYNNEEDVEKISTILMKMKEEASS